MRFLIFTFIGNLLFYDAFPDFVIVEDILNIKFEIDVLVVHTNV